MLILKDINDRDDLVKSFRESLERQRYALVVRNKLSTNTYSEVKLGGNTRDELLKKFNESNYWLVGASHGTVMSPLFALLKDDKSDEVKVSEYLTYEQERMVHRIEEDLSMLAIFISINFPAIKKIRLPSLILENFENDECKLEDKGGYMELAIKAG